MIRFAVLLALAALVALTACRQEEPYPAEIPRQTTPTPVAPTPEGAPAATIEDVEFPYPSRQEVDVRLGEQVYQAHCATCHREGIAGAPAEGDEEDWRPRLARGYEALVLNAINGFQGEAGVMPPRGGNPNLTDEEVAAAVAYMMEINE